MNIPRLRMFAGPNGSGKSTIKEKIDGINSNWLGLHVNPDDIEKSITKIGYLDFGQFKLKINRKEIFDSLENSTLLQEKGLLAQVNKLNFNKNSPSFTI